MKITLEQTSQMVDVNGVTCRVWEGETEKGIKISALIPRIAVATTQNTSQFEAELQEAELQEQLIANIIPASDPGD